MLLDELKAVLGRSQKTEWRKFGITMGIFFGLIAGFLFWRGKVSAEYFTYIAGFFLAAGLIIPIILKPIYIGWMAFATVLGFFMSRVILTLLFTLVFTPAGVVMRILRKDNLSERIEPDRSSYWLQRERGEFDPKTVETQY
jgi:hypothetical protein